MRFPNGSVAWFCLALAGTGCSDTTGDSATSTGTGAGGDVGSGTGGASSTSGVGATTGAGGNVTGGPELAWFSDWRTGTGSEQTALYDGGKWNDQLCAGPVAEVVSADGLDFPTTHVFRSDYATPGECLMVRALNQWPAPNPGGYLFVRAYYRNAIPDGATIGFPHPLHIGESPAGPYATWFNFAGPSSGVSSMTLQLGGGPEYPDQYWSYGFAVNQTYRLEVRMHRATDSTAQIDLRVYDDTNTLVADSEDWTNGETNENARTLAQSNPTYPVTDASFRLLEIGNNDPAGLTAGPNRYVYWGAIAVVVSDDPEDWPGPYPAPAEAR